MSSVRANRDGLNRGSKVTLWLPCNESEAAEYEAQIQAKVDAGLGILVVAIPSDVEPETLDAISQGIEGLVGELT